MENIRLYIESGVLELYVLDDISPAERLQVEVMASTHQQVKSELNEIEYALEQYALKNAVGTRTLLRRKILNNLADN